MQRFSLLFFFLAFSSLVLADSSMSAQPWGAVYQNGNDVLNVTVSFGGRLPPHWQGVAVSTITQQVVNSTDWNFTSSFNPPSLGVVRGLENLSVSVSANRINRIEQVGSGLWLFWTTPTGGYSLALGDLISTAGAQCLSASETSSRTAVTVTLSNWANYCGGNTVHLDPTISQFSRSPFAQGAFNNTAALVDVNAISQNYFSNKSFAASGTYFSPPFYLSRKAYSQVNSISTTWYESNGFGVSDTAVVDLHFENASGNANNVLWKDASRYNNTWNNAFPQNSVAFNSSCYLGGCVVFNATANGGLVSSTEAGIGQNYTVSLWFDYVGDFTSQAIAGYLWGRGINAPAQYDTLGICGTYVNCQQVQFGGGLFAYNGTSIVGAGILHGTQNITKGGWYHAVYTHGSDGNVTLYLNGTFQGTQIIKNSYGTSQSWRLGQRMDTFAPLNGSIDEFHIYNRTLSPSEVTQIYNNEKGLQGTSNFPHNLSSVGTASRTKYMNFDDTGLIAWWDLGDSSDNESVTNTSLDLSGSAGKLTLYNPTVNASGVIGKALQMSNTKNSYAAIPLTSQMAVMQDMTASVWVYPNDVNTYQAVLGAMVPNPGNGWNIAIANGRPVAQVLEISIPVIRNLTGPAITAGQWHLLTLRLDQFNQNATFYVDGVLVNTTMVNSDATLATDLSIGAFSGQSANTQLKPYFNGLIDDVKMWNRTLTDAEIASFFNHSSTEGNWSAWTADDYSGNATSPSAAGSLGQYRLTLNSTVNTSAWVSNVTVNWVNLTATAPQWYGLAANNSQRGADTQFSVNCTAIFPSFLGKYLFQLDNGSGSLTNQGGFINFNNSVSQIATFNATINATWNSLIRYRFICYDSTSLLSNTTDIGSFTTTEAQAPSWDLNSTNQTLAGLPALFTIRWVSSIGLSNWTFELDNGTGSFVNFSGTFTGSVNFSNVTVGLNPTQQSTIRYRWYARDVQGNANSTPLFSFLAFQQKPQIFNQCPNGDYLVNHAGNFRYVNHGDTGPRANPAFCQLSLINTNNTYDLRNAMMTDLGNDLFNYTLNITNSSHYLVFINCSETAPPNNPASAEMFDINVVPYCTNLSLAVNAGGEQGNMFEFAFLGFLLIIALALIAIAIFSQASWLLSIGGIFLMFAGFAVFSQNIGFGVAQLANYTTTLSTDASGNLIGTTMTPNYVNVTDNMVGAVGLIFLLAGLGLFFVGVMRIYGEIAKKSD